MKLKVHHTTRYQYSEPVSHSVNEVCLIPRATGIQLCDSSVLDISPVPDTLETHVDVYGNLKSHFTIESPHVDCVITATSVISAMDRQSGERQGRTIPKTNGNRSLNKNEKLMATDCLLPSHYIQDSTLLRSFVSELQKQINFEAPAHELAQNLGAYIFKNFTYDPNFSTVVTPLDDIIASRRGVCQDFAHLAIAVLRFTGTPARYVSGYLETLPPPGQEKLQGADASHAWYSVFSTDDGWLDYDPTNNKLPDLSYITTAWGRDYADVAPLRGVVTGGGQHQLFVAVDVERSLQATSTSVVSE